MSTIICFYQKHKKLLYSIIFILLIPILFPLLETLINIIFNLGKYIGVLARIMQEGQACF